MASSLTRHAAKITFFVVIVSICQVLTESRYNPPNIYSLTVKSSNESSCEDAASPVEFEVSGENLYKGIKIKTTEHEANQSEMCREDSKTFTIGEIVVNATFARLFVWLPSDFCGNNIYLCVPHEEYVNSDAIPPNKIYGTSVTNWYHQGAKVVITRKCSDKCSRRYNE